MKSPFARAASLFALALLLAGCSKKISQPDASFTTPEGIPGNALMVGWADQSVSAVVLGDPGTPDDPSDDTVLENETFFFADTAGARFQIWDGTNANGFQVFRATANGALTRLYDYDARPTRKYLFERLDIFEFEDTAPLSNTSDYIGRGTFNGVVAANSPLTNRVLPLGHIDSGLEITIPRVVRDSVLRLGWVPDPRATFYIVEFLDAGAFTSRRDLALRSALPSPIMSDSRVFNFKGIVLPSQIPLVIPLYPAPFPLHLFIRITAYDANFRMVSRNFQDAATFSREIPPGSPFRRVYEVLPLGGVLVTMDPYNQGTLQPSLGSDVMARVPSSPVQGAQRIRVSERPSSMDAPAAIHGMRSPFEAPSFSRLRQLIEH